MRFISLSMMCFSAIVSTWAQTPEDLKAYASTFPPMPRDVVGLNPLLVPGTQLTFASSTPYNDVEYSLFDTDFIEGETAGYDVFCPVDPADSFPGSDTVKLVLCVSNVVTDDIYGAAQGDRVILGVEALDVPFFMRGLDGLDNDYAVIRHFDFEHGHIQLSGSVLDYDLVYGTQADGCATEGWYLFFTKDDHLDLIAFIFPCWDVDVVMPAQDMRLMCNDDDALDLNDKRQFSLAEPISSSPVIEHGVRQFGSIGKEIVHGVVVDQEGCMYVFGAGDGNLDGGVDPDNEMFVIKLDGGGTQMWVTELGNTNGDLLFDAAIDDRYLYAVGRTQGSLPGFQNRGSWDAILVKIDRADGRVVAMDQWGAQGIDGYGNITLDDAGHVYVSGAGSPPGGPATGDNVYLVAKHRADTLANVWRMLDPVLPEADKVTEAWGGITYVPDAEPGHGRLVVGGWFRPPGNPPKGADGFVAVYGDLDQTKPAHLAVQVISSPGFKADWVLDNAADGDGNIYAIGYTTGDLQGGQRGEGDMFVVKFDRDLANPIFAQWGSDRSDMFRKLEIDDLGHLYAIGHTYGDYGFSGYQGQNADPSGLSGDIVIQKFDTDLTPLAAVQFGTEHEERGFACPGGDRLFVAGMTEGSLVGANLGSFDAFCITLDMEDLSVADAGVGKPPVDEFPRHAYLPLSLEGEDYQVVLGLMNAANDPTNWVVHWVGADGLTVKKPLFGRLGPKARHLVSLDAEWTTGDVWLLVGYDHELDAYVHLTTRDGKESAFIKASKTLSPRVIVPHIAQDVSNWHSYSAWVNGSDESVDVFFDHADGSLELVSAQQPFAQAAVEWHDDVWVDSAHGQMPPWGTLSATGPGLAGMEMFARKGGINALAGLDLPAHAVRELFFAHVAADRTVWWTGLAIANVDLAPIDVMFVPYDGLGRPLPQVSHRLESGQKLVGLVEDIWSTAGEVMPADMAWIRVEATGSMVGYELFGNRGAEPRLLAAVNAATEGSHALIYPHVEANAACWTGIAAVNIGVDRGTLTARAYDAAGQVLIEDGAIAELAANQKFVVLADELFGDAGFPEGTVTIELGCDQPLIGFQLWGNLEPQQETLSGMLAISADGR